MQSNLKQIRMSRSISQAEMAQMVGVKVATYGTWERGERTPNASQLLRCAEVLDCSCDAILGHETGDRYADPMERALHMTWERLNEHDRQMVLDVARNAADAAQRRGKTDSGPGDTVQAAG